MIMMIDVWGAVVVVLNELEEIMIIDLKMIMIHVDMIKMILTDISKFKL